MSHHFDTPTAREDPRINVCDFYLFSGRAGATAMAMTVNPDAGLSAPVTFQEEGLYAFRFDLDGDLKEEVASKVTFGPVSHEGGSEHVHVQDVTVRHMRGPAAVKGIAGEVIAHGPTGRVVEAGSVRAFAGLVPDLFAGDATAFGAFRKALFEHGRFAPEAFQSPTNFCAHRNVCAIVLEVPNEMLRDGPVGGWVTASLHGHAPEMQVSRWGYPLLTNMFMPDEDMKERFSRLIPVEDHSEFAAQVGSVAERIAAPNGSGADRTLHAQRLLARLFPSTLPYVPGSPGAFAVSGCNGRVLTDDVMDVVLTLAANTPLGDGVAPSPDRVRAEFPYFGPAYSRAEQRGVAPARAQSAKKEAPMTS